MAHGRTSARRSTGGPINYAEAVLADDENDELLQGDDMKLARQEQITQELAAARLARKKRDEDDADFGKLTKKEKKKKNKYVEYKGKLSSIFTLPMDLLSTIFSELDPLDLLHLSRANKQLNQFLSSREATSIWSISRRNLELYVPKVGVYDYYGDRISEDTYETVQMPPRPANLTETAYARLLFENECSDCDGKIHYTDYALGKKLCKTCKKDSIVKKHVAVEALKAGKKKAVVEEIVFSLVTQPYNYRSDTYYLPALISLHDEIKDKKRKLRKKGEYDAWLSAKKEEKEEQDKTSQSRALAIGHWLPRFKQYGRLDTRRAERAKYQQIIKRKEEKEAAQAVLAANRLPAIEEYVSLEPWYNVQHWNAFIESTSGKRLVHKATNFSKAEWESIKGSLEAELAARKAFTESLDDWKRKGAMRSWITARASVDIPSAIHALKGSMNVAGELLALPAVGTLLDLQAPGHQKYGAIDDESDDEFVPWGAGDRDAFEEYRANRERAWKEALPDIIVQLRDRQIWILSDLVDKLAAKGTLQKTAAQVLDTLGHELDGNLAPAKAGKAENGPEEALQRAKDLQQARHPQVRALRALYAALTDLRAVFSCRTCKPRRGESEAVLKIQTALSHEHFIHETRERKYEASSTLTGYQTPYGVRAPLTVPAKWRSEDVVHFPSAGPAIDLLLATIARHNEETKIKQYVTAAAEVAALSEKTNAASKAAANADADGASTIPLSSDEDDVKPLAINLYAKPSVGIVVGPKTLADIDAFNTQYRFTCTKNQNCDRRVPWQKKVYKKLQRDWDAMTIHLMDHIHAAQDAEEILITVSSIGIVRKTAHSDHPYLQ